MFFGVIERDQRHEMVNKDKQSVVYRRNVYSVHRLWILQQLQKHNLYFLEVVPVFLLLTLNWVTPLDS